MEFIKYSIKILKIHCIHYFPFLPIQSPLIKAPSSVPLCHTTQGVLFIKKKDTNELISKRERDSQTEKKLTVTKGERGLEVGINQEVGIKIYTLLI